MSITAAQPTLDTELKRVRGLLKSGHYGDAMQAAKSLLADGAESRDVLLILAQGQRYLGLTADALHTLERLEHAHPAFSRIRPTMACYNPSTASKSLCSI